MARGAKARQGRKFLGAKAVLQQAFDAAPKTTEPRRNPNPRIAAAHTPERVHAIRILLAFLRASRDAWSAWRHGKRDQVFPAGTYAFRVHPRVAWLAAGLLIIRLRGTGSSRADRGAPARAPRR